MRLRGSYRVTFSIPSEKLALLEKGEKPSKSKGKMSFEQWGIGEREEMVRLKDQQSPNMTWERFQKEHWPSRTPGALHLAYNQTKRAAALSTEDTQSQGRPAVGNIHTQNLTTPVMPVKRTAGETPESLGDTFHAAKRICSDSIQIPQPAAENTTSHVSLGNEHHQQPPQSSLPGTTEPPGNASPNKDLQPSTPGVDSQQQQPPPPPPPSEKVTPAAGQDPTNLPPVNLIWPVKPIATAATSSSVSSQKASAPVHIVSTGAYEQSGPGGIEIAAYDLAQQFTASFAELQHRGVRRKHEVSQHEAKKALAIGIFHELLGDATKERLEALEIMRQAQKAVADKNENIKSLQDENKRLKESLTESAADKERIKQLEAENGTLHGKLYYIFHCVQYQPNSEVPPAPSFPPAP
ncbi:hypothetical protein BGW36DRAFT_431023 [Talaromyces proteolyticus]|uniref:Uncharacterized protein n=1 Tax=Talaromyces proteolyticus TaxID=1131652 RepID=A0AAD4KPU5_9EURO|nr:uncharacterized protein BGW36DRAFT_431023 [Talaromyces proteolyticus]KAH8693291.1 hypothetical protein BGW36DRAFT_431023 [Talaromyces proteolyticus]